MSNALISVIIPTKDRSFELSRAIKSVLFQSYQQFEILIIDDHSNEDIQAVISSFDEKRIKYFKSEKQPSNANVCRNIGFEAAIGEYIAMLDSDDEWLPDHLSLRVKEIEQKGADGLFGSYKIFDGESYKNVVSRPVNPNETMADYLLTDGHAATPTQFYRASAAKQIRWNEELERHQDYDFTIRFASNFKFKASQEISVVVHWRKGETRLQHFQSQKLFIEIHKSEISKKIYNLYHQKVFESLRSNSDVSKEIVKHYDESRFRYYHAISLIEFLGNQSGSPSKLRRLLLRIKYAFKVLFSG